MNQITATRKHQVPQLSLADKVIRAAAGLHDEGYRAASHSLMKQLVLDYSKCYQRDNIDSQAKTVDAYLYQLSGRTKATGILKTYCDLFTVETDGSLKINESVATRWRQSKLGSK